jgi:hypothetical protein
MQDVLRWLVRISGAPAVRHRHGRSDGRVKFGEPLLTALSVEEEILQVITISSRKGSFGRAVSLSSKAPQPRQTNKRKTVSAGSPVADSCAKISVGSSLRIDACFQDWPAGASAQPQAVQQILRLPATSRTSRVGDIGAGGLTIWPLFVGRSSSVGVLPLQQHRPIPH